MSRLVPFWTFISSIKTDIKRPIKTGWNQVPSASSRDQKFKWWTHDELHYHCRKHEAKLGFLLCLLTLVPWRLLVSLHSGKMMILCAELLLLSSQHFVKCVGYSMLQTLFSYHVTTCSVDD